MHRYHYPLSEEMEVEMHTPRGVKSLVQKSRLWDLLRQLERDGHDVSGAAAELSALVNYASSTSVSLADLQTHLDYCAEVLRRQTSQA